MRWSSSARLCWVPCWVPVLGARPHACPVSQVCLSMRRAWLILHGEGSGALSDAAAVSLPPITGAKQSLFTDTQLLLPFHTDFWLKWSEQRLQTPSVPSSKTSVSPWSQGVRLDGESFLSPLWKCSFSRFTVGNVPPECRRVFKKSVYKAVALRTISLYICPWWNSLLEPVSWVPAPVTMH